MRKLLIVSVVAAVAVTGVVVVSVAMNRNSERAAADRPVAALPPPAKKRACPDAGQMTSQLQNAGIPNAVPSLTQISSSSTSWVQDANQLPAGTIQCQYTYLYAGAPPADPGNNTVEIDVIPDPNGSNYLQMADAMIQNDVGTTSQPSPPIGQESIANSSETMVLANMTNGATLEVTDDSLLGSTYGLGVSIEPLARIVSGMANGN